MVIEQSWLLLHTVCKINLRWVMHVNITAKTMKLKKKNYEASIMKHREIFMILE